VLVLTGALVACDTPEPTLEGLWLSQGYGFLIEIDSTTATPYEVTEISCIPSGDVMVRESVEPDGSWRLNARNDPSGAFLILESASTARLKRTGTASDIMLRRAAARPVVCDQPVADTPLTNFDVFWTVYKEHYPLFEMKDLDWDSVRTAVRPQITDATTPDELFDLLTAMIAPLEDAHTSIASNSSDRQFWGHRADPDLDGLSTIPEAIGKLEITFGQALDIIESRYLQGELRSFCNGHLQFGQLPGGVAYIRLDGEGGYTDLPGFAAQLETMEAALDTIFTASQDASGVILDVRKNFGGSDLLSLALASRLAGEEYFAFAKVARLDPDDPDQRTPPQERHVPVSSRPSFHGPVAQLIGPYTISAGETLTQALMGREPHIVRVGENTQGVFSDVLGRRLPNGWEVGLPNELFLTESGEYFDGPGIPPDVTVPVFRADDIAAGRDPALERALELLDGG